MITVEELKQAPELIATADWWTGHLKSPPPKDNGEGMSSILGSMATAAVNRVITDQQIQTFRDSLLNAMAEAFVAHWDSTESWREHDRLLRVDYSPDHILDSALQAAGIKGDVTSPLPWKSHTKTNKGRVTSKMGYGAESIQIYPASVAVVGGEKIQH